MFSAIVGWLAAFFLAVCGVPQAILSFKQGHSRGISWGLLNMWALGEFFMFIYILPMASPQLICTSIVNLAAVSIILYFKIKDRYMKEETTIGDLIKKLPKTIPYYYGSPDDSDE